VAYPSSIRTALNLSAPSRIGTARIQPLAATGGWQARGGGFRPPLS